MTTNTNLRQRNLKNLVMDQIAPAYDTIGAAVDEMMSKGTTVEDLRKMWESAGLAKGCATDELEKAALTILTDALGGLIRDLKMVE